MATRRAHVATSEILAETIDLLKASGYGLILLETAGIGHSDSEVVDLVDYSMYVMTSDYGAASQLEKIDMLDFADMIALNKFEKRGAEDALRDIKKQWRRNHVAFEADDADIPVYPTIASQFNDPGVNHLFQALINNLVEKLGLNEEQWQLPAHLAEAQTDKHPLIPGSRQRYLAEIAEAGRATHSGIDARAQAASLAQSYYDALKALEDARLPDPLSPCDAAASLAEGNNAVNLLRQRYNAALETVGTDGVKLLREWPGRKDAVKVDTYSYKVRGREVTGDNYTESLSGTRVPKIAPPRFADWGEQLRFLMEENLPGGYPYTAGVYPYRRAKEDPTRQFAGEGTPERTNRRFHYLSEGQPATRLSTAFDSVTLYGEDPDERPDIYGRIGNSGVSIATVDDMKKLYSGFDLAAKRTSVSMTINGPAPMILAMFMNAAIDQQVERHLRETGGWEEALDKIKDLWHGSTAPVYEGERPRDHDGFGLGTIGVSGDQLVDAETYGRIRAETMKKVRGTVQADILKEDRRKTPASFRPISRCE
jgi:methylmalonyl-CoA mutase